METEVALALVGILVRTVVVRQVGGQWQQVTGKDIFYSVRKVAVVDSILVLMESRYNTGGADFKCHDDVG